MSFDAPSPIEVRTALIAQARRAWIDGDARAAPERVEPWLTRSWQRCLAAGRRPQQRVVFDAVSAASMRRATDRSAQLLRLARPVLDRLSRAVVDTRYFAILTDADGIVIDIGAQPDAGDPYAHAIARIGLDLSERAVGTTAIGAALAERASVWLHRGEHFFDDTSVYTCAGAPLIDPRGRCIGMLDLTGVNVLERPALRQLAQRSAHAIEDALVRAQPCALLLQLNWPGCLAEPGASAGAEGDGLLCLDADGRVTGANAAARQLLQLTPTAGPAAPPACTDLFAVPTATLFDAGRRHPAAIEVPLWSGLRMHVRATRSAGMTVGAAAPSPTRPAVAPVSTLRDVESALIRHAVEEARGNVAQAARALGISRATMYRKLGRGHKPT
jgi:transcriptional regulator of acetoin/glycerol metabolism